MFASELNRFWGLISISLCGACLGFLPHNFPRAKIFIGDGGSFFLGFSLAVLGVMGEWSNQSVSRATIPLLILALPIFDLVFVVVTRHQSGVTRTWIEALQHCARDHLSHRLVFLGLSPTQAVMVLHAVAIFLALSAIILRAVESPTLTYMHLVQAGMVLLILGVLIKVGSRKGMT
jgi:UDP-GlcNAc:undecaprenyl-phosphate GlcNAc-1-phosphate transferase